MTKRTDKIKLKDFAKRGLSFLLSTAMVITSVTGFSLVTQEAPEAKAAVTTSGLPDNSGYLSSYTTLNSGHSTLSGYYVVNQNLNITHQLKVSGTAFLEVRKGFTLTVTGGTGGKAGINVSYGNTLVILGEGTVKAYGGSAESGENGSSGSSYSVSGDYVSAGNGGAGGAGGCGAGAGIGTDGGAGGSGGYGGSNGGSIKYTGNDQGSKTGGSGGAGSKGSASGSMGTLYILGKVTVSATGGSSGYRGGYAGTNRNGSGVDKSYKKNAFYHTRHTGAVGGSGGGGGGAGYAGAGIGTGGAGGGGGGGGGAGGVWKQDDHSFSGYYYKLYGGNGSGGSGSSSGSSSSVSKGTYGGYGGSGAGSSYAGSPGTYYKSARNAVSTSGGSYSTYTSTGRIASQGTSTTYPSDIKIKMDDTSSVNGTQACTNGSGSRNVMDYSDALGTRTSYATMKIGASSLTKGIDAEAESIRKPGYTFKGWYDEDGNQILDGDGNIVNIIENLTTNGLWNNITIRTLKAKWERNTYHLKFNGNGGYYNQTMNVYTAEALPTINMMKRDGYNLIGFNTKKDGSGVWVYGNGKVNPATNAPTDDNKVTEPNTTDIASKNWSSYKFKGTGTTVTGVYPFEYDTELYAIWTPITYNIRYWSEDDTGQPVYLGEDENVSYVDLVLKAPADFDGYTREHYEFKGWNLYSGQNWAMFDANKQYYVGLTTDQGAWVNVYAAWQIFDSYSITYNANGGQASPVTEIDFEGEDHVIHQYDPGSPQPRRKNYTFKGWNTSVDGVGDAYENKVGMTETEIAEQGTIKNLSENITLYAMWEKNPSLTYHANGGSFSVGMEKQYPTKGSTVYAALSSQTTDQDGTTVLTDGMNPVKDEEGQYITVDLPTREGYKFAGWSTTPVVTGASKVYKDGGETSFTMGSDNLTLYAVWEEETYKIICDTSNTAYSLAVKTSEDEDFVSYNGSNPPAVKYKSDYEFTLTVKDYADASKMVVYVNGAVVPVRSVDTDGNGDKVYKLAVKNAREAQEIVVTNVSYTAYNIHYVTNGGEFTGDYVEEYIYTLDVGDVKNLPTETAINKTGYTFDGWYEKKDFSDDEGKVTTTPLGKFGDKTYYAKWTPNDYAIVFDGNGGKVKSSYIIPPGDTVSADNTKYTMNNCEYGGLVTLLGDEFIFQGTDYSSSYARFLGWSRDKEATSPEYLKEGLAINLATGEEDDESITLYAVWQQPTRKVTYYGNGGSLEKTSTEYIKDENGITTSTDEAKSTLYTLTSDVVQGENVAVDFDDNISTHRNFGSEEAGYEEKYDFWKRTGYTFLGWSTNPTATEPEYKNVEGYKEIVAKDPESDPDKDNTKDIILYAVWKENTYTVEFRENSANGGYARYHDTDSAAYNDPAWDNDSPTADMLAAREYFTQEFTYSHLDALKSFKAYPGGFSIGFMNIADVETVFMNEVESKFSENDGYDILAVKRESESTWKGTTRFLLGWATEADATKPDFLLGESITGKQLANLTGAADGAIIQLYAVWADAKTVYASYNANGGAFEPVTAEEKSLANTLSDAIILPSGDDINNYTVDYLDGTATIGGKSYTLKREGYEFCGWAETPDGEVQYKKTEDNSAETKSITSTTESFVLYAVWKPVEYKVTFPGAGGTVGGTDAGATSKEQEFAYGTGDNLEANSFVYAGHEFAGWTTVNPDAGTGESGVVEYVDGQYVINLTNTKGDNIDLYAVWNTAQTYYLSYNANGGTGGPAMQVLVKGIAGKVYVEDEYQPVLDEYGNQVEEDGEPVFERTVAMPTWEGRAFLGWSKDDPNGQVEFSEEKTDSENQITLTDGNAGDVTLYAQWKKKTPVYVEYDENGGTPRVPNDAKVYYEGDTVNVKFNRIPSLAGYEFAGWELNGVPYEEGNSNVYGVDTAQSTATTYSAFIIKDDSYVINGEGDAAEGTITMKALWKPHQYQIRYHSDETEVVSEKIAYGTKVKLTSFEYLENVERSFAPKAGYEFAGWSCRFEGGADYEDKAEVSNLAVDDGAIIDLYAVYEPITINVSFKSVRSTGEYEVENREVIYGESMPVLNDIPTRYGYSFTGYYSSSEIQNESTQIYTEDLLTEATNLYSEDVNLYAGWEADTYEVYYQQGGAQLASQQISYGDEIRIYTKADLSGLELEEDEKLVGWSFGKGDEAPAEGLGITSDMQPITADETTGLYNDGKNIVLYAVIVENKKYTLTYDANGGYNAPVDRNKYEVGSTVDVKVEEEAKRGGYTFLGWNTDGSSTVPKYNSGKEGAVRNENMEIYGDTTLYAIWRSNKYSLRYEPNYEDSQDTVVKDNLTYTQESYTFKDADLFTRKGYTLLGWATSPKGGVAYEAGGTINTALSSTDGATVTLYAVWEAGGYTVAFDGNQPKSAKNKVTGEMKNQSMSFDVDTNLRANAYKLTDYVFMGWSTTPDGEVEYEDTQEVVNLALEVDETVTLYAVWASEEDAVDWSSKKLLALVSDVYSINCELEKTPDISGLNIIALYTDGSSRVIKDYKTNVKELDTTAGGEQILKISHTQGNITKSLSILVKYPQKVEEKVEDNVVVVEEGTVAAALEQFANINTDVDAATGSAFRKLQLKATGKKNKIKLGWKDITGVTGYVILGAKVGDTMEEIARIDSTRKSYVVTDVDQDTYYKYVVLAFREFDGSERVVTISDTVYVTPKGGTTINPKNLKVQSKTAMTLAPKQKVKLKAKVVGSKKKLQNIISPLRYESSKKAVVKVTKKGKLKAKKAGTAVIYIYTQNGLCKKVKVTVSKAAATATTTSTDKTTTTTSKDKTSKTSKTDKTTEKTDKETQKTNK